MATKKIVFLDRDTIPASITIPTPNFVHQWIEYQSTSPEQVLERIYDADVVISNKVYLGSDILEQAKQVKHIAVAATGVNNVELDYCAQRGITVTNVQGYATQSVPEHVIALLFTLMRNIPAYHDDIRNGEWQRQNKFCFFTHPIQDIAHSTLGIIGSGALGQATAALARAIGMNVQFSERKGVTQCREGYVPFERFLKTSDAIALLCPLTEETTNLIDSEALSNMKSTAVLINTGRGGLVNEADLVCALKENHIAGAGVDVFTEEPAPQTNPLVENMDLPNLILTPHVAWGSRSSIEKLCEILVSNIEAVEQGKTQNRVV
ncbi:D-2-hydroxyacid dehydrogenase [Vibrio barjaei]|uniref:D-2-hydroxyacid dehydrogenase n=1 Tax=Vibrio barjaei TaxID=1676683 RepID=UPI0022846AD8|nr:D-2-hydroxyacid dehydrogenase [Vibrio barjaei]MCY9869633.1 D-2-hydroxyacid dehydrogenase [Vibrio barjaei]